MFTNSFDHLVNESESDLHKTTFGDKAETGCNLQTLLTFLIKRKTLKRNDPKQSNVGQTYAGGGCGYAKISIQEQIVHGLHCITTEKQQKWLGMKTTFATCGMETSRRELQTNQKFLVCYRNAIS